MDKIWHSAGQAGEHCILHLGHTSFLACSEESQLPCGGLPHEKAHMETCHSIVSEGLWLANTKRMPYPEAWTKLWEGSGSRFAWLTHGLTAFQSKLSELLSQAPLDVRHTGMIDKFYLKLMY